MRKYVGVLSSELLLGYLWRGWNRMLISLDLKAIQRNECWSGLRCNTCTPARALTHTGTHTGTHTDTPGCVRAPVCTDAIGVCWHWPCWSLGRVETIETVELVEINWNWLDFLSKHDAGNFKWIWENWFVKEMSEWRVGCVSNRFGQ